MEAMVVTGLWMLLFGTHVGLATRRVRAALVARLGEGGFTVLYSAIAAVAFAALVGYYAAHRFAGPAGLAAGDAPAARWLLTGVIVAGVVLAGAGLAVYARLPMALFDQRIGRPRGIERVTRHPFFAGAAVVAGAHALLATRLVGTAFAAGFVLLALVGAWHQDRKLLARRGASYADYLAATSLVPFAAIARGRGRLVAGEIAPRTLLQGVAVAVVIRLLHDHLFAHGGAWIVGATLAGAALASLQAHRRARRAGIEAAGRGRAAAAPGAGGTARADR